MQNQGGQLMWKGDNQLPQYYREQAELLENNFEYNRMLFRPIKASPIDMKMDFLYIEWTSLIMQRTRNMHILSPKSIPFNSICLQASC